MRMIRILAVLLFFFLSACSVASNPVMQSIQALIKSDDSSGLNPNYRYLRVVVDGHVVFWALGNTDRDANGPIEVWYSAERAVFRFQNGRLVGSVGLPVEWRNVVLPQLPAWSELSRMGHSFSWERVRDVMPDYRFGIHDKLGLRAIPVPDHSEIRDLNPATLTWFEETSVSANSNLPAARYAVDLREGGGSVVYGEQCLSADFCFSWQRWSVAPNSGNKSQLESKR